ncbi:MAG: DUF3237 domain-containing protein [Acidobacteriia bacterium]|nr:DUF3237 domain-containing protein [Terriglobia bacterium]
MPATTRRRFAKFAAAAAVGSTSLGAQSTTGAGDDKTLKSEFLLDLVLDTQPANNVGSPGVNRVIVPVSGGTFTGPKLKGTVVGPGGDWILRRPDGSSILDVRIILQTDDNQKIYMTYRGISITPQGGTQYWRIVPVFETGAEKYAWLNNIVAVGVHRTMPGKVAYRIYQIL